MSRTVLLIVALGAVAAGCGSNGSLEGVDGPCTRSSDCQPGLSCGADGFCKGPDAGPAPDGGADGNDSGGDASSAG